MPSGNSDAIHAQDCTLIDVEANLVADQLAELNSDDYQTRIFVCQTTGIIVILRRAVCRKALSNAADYGEWERIAEVDPNG